MHYYRTPHSDQKTSLFIIFSHHIIITDKTASSATTPSLHTTTMNAAEESTTTTTATSAVSSSSSSSSPLAAYFKFEPLLGSHWDADLSPEEYGDQSEWNAGHDSWDDSDSDSDSDSNCYDDDDDCCSESDNDWNVVYASASITATATTTMTRTKPSLDGEQECPDTPTTASSSSSSITNCCFPTAPLTRKDSKVTFCSEPPQVVCYEKCNLEDHSRLYYSVHELQSIMDEVKLEKEKYTAGSGTCAGASNMSVNKGAITTSTRTATEVTNT